MNDLCERLKKIEKECSELAKAGEHPEWHVYEMCEYDAKNKIVQIAYKKGFIRIGINRREKVIGVEGYPKALKNRMQQIKLIVEKFNNENGEEYTLSVNPIK